jgi:hypothetical protein
MYRLAYLFPLLTSGAMIVLFNDYEHWASYLALAAAAMLGIKAVIKGSNKDKEYWSAYSIAVEHHEPWTERVETTRTYTDNKGQTHTRTEVTYVRHPDRWLMYLNTGHVETIDSSFYDFLCARWGTPMEYIRPFHSNCVRGGGGQQYKWNGVYWDAATRTYERNYENYILHSNSIFRFEKVTKEVAAEYGLIDYPYFRGDHDVVMVSSNLPETFMISEDVQRHFQLLNAFAGSTCQIHVFVLVYDAEKGLETALKQRAYWEGGNKNEFVVCLGVENPDSPVVRWCKAFSWCDVPSLETATESYFIEHKELNLLKYAAWLKENLHLWKRKEFSDFKYLGVNMSSKRKFCLALVTVLVCAVLVVISFKTAIGRMQYNEDGECVGYGYELLEKYLRRHNTHTLE